MRRLIALTTLVLVSTAWTVGAQPRSARLRRMVVVGDSLLAGFGSGGLVATGRPGQVDSTPAFIARRAHVPLRQPLMDSPGVPPQLRIVDANRNGTLDPGEVRRTQGGLGFRSDTDHRARNLAVPGEDTASVFETIAPDDVAGKIVSGNPDGQEILKFLILGFPLRSGSVSQVTAARDLDPSFILVWIGNNDLLDVATMTNPSAVRVSPAEFGDRYRRLLGQLADTGAGMAVANLPDPTHVAALRHASTDVTSCRTPDGATHPVAPDDLLSIDLDPRLLPVPPCGKVLDATERAAVRATVDAFNAQIAAAVQETTTARGVQIALVDIAGTLDTIAQDGIDLNGDGTPDVTTGYLGGLFSLDGIHPTRTGNAILANVFIQAIDGTFGETISEVNVARVAAHDPLAHSRFRPSGEPPFGLIEENDDELETFFTNIYDDIARDAHDLRHDLEDIFGNLF
jgi:GDSL-like lipase/acylhydrolase family protein